MASTCLDAPPVSEIAKRHIEAARRYRLTYLPTLRRSTSTKLGLLLQPRTSLARIVRAKFTRSSEIERVCYMFVSMLVQHCEGTT